MRVFEIVIVGAGPAGMAAAVEARKSGAEVAVVDDNSAIGGQIWRGGVPPEFARSFVDCGAQLLLGSPVVAADAIRRTIATEEREVGYRKLILATGARELFLPFPGWTLPGVCGVGGLQALVKSGLRIAGKRVIVAGSGPLLLAVAGYLREHGAIVPVIAEQASGKSLRGFGGALLRHPSKIAQALRIKRSVLGTSYLTESWVTCASGAGSLEQVTLLQNGKERRERCDYLAVGYGFSPNTELAQLLGCRLEDDLVAVDGRQGTSVRDVYCAGEPTGLGGIDEALIEGRVAGGAASGRTVVIDRRRSSHFTRSLKTAFRLRSELKQAVTADTIVCRCEDVPMGRLQEAKNWREAKLHFRCGMGPCHGRICGPAVNYLFDWKAESVRPPIFSTKLQNLIATEEMIVS